LTVAVTETKREVAGVVAGVACLISLASLEGSEEKKVTRENSTASPEPDPEDVRLRGPVV
jgi:hypothetical protein